MPSCQPSILVLILEYNTTNHSNFPSNNFEENINPRLLNNGKEEIRPANTTGNNNENIRLIDID